MKFYKTTTQFQILMQRLFTRQNLKELFFVILGTFITALPIYFIYNPLKLVSGGVGGVGIVIESLSKGVFKTSYTFWIGNIFALILALVVFGKFYFFKTIVGSLTLPLFILIFELTVRPTYFVEKLFTSIDGKLLAIANNEINVSVLPTSIILICVALGAFLTAFGLYIVFRNNGSTGGFDVIQKVAHKYAKVPYSVAIYATDGIIALSSILTGVTKLYIGFFGFFTIFLIGYLIDFFCFRAKKAFTAYIISENSKDLAAAIFKRFSRTYTLIPVKGGYSGKSKNMVVFTIDKTQIHALRELLTAFDPNAFSYIQENCDIIGAGFKNHDF